MCEDEKKENYYFFKGYGSIHSFQAFIGVNLYFYDLQVKQGKIEMAMIEKMVSQKDTIIEINYCRGGRYECEFENDTLYYLGEGDTSISKFAEKKKNFQFPIERYQGINVLVDTALLMDELIPILENFNIDYKKLLEKWESCLPCKIFEDSRAARDVFEPLYEQEDDMDSGYLRCKLIELLLLFQASDIKNIAKNKYISREQVSSVKEVKKHLENNLDREITMMELSEEYESSISTIKNCFYAVYGKSPAQYRKEFRMHTAAKLLIETDDSVAEIGMMVGYLNASKFANAFRSVVKMSPLEYRRKKITVYVSGRRK